MSKAARNSVIDKLLSDLTTLEEAVKSVFESSNQETVAGLVETADTFKDAVEKQYEEDESVLDEDDEPATERLEALENAKDIADNLHTWLQETKDALEELEDKFQEIRGALFSAKES